jgi:hypothetical protein
MSIVKAPGNGARQRELDIQVGEVRLIVISEPGLVGLYRGDEEQVTLVRAEALTIARTIIEQFAHDAPEPVPAHDGYAIVGRTR